MQAFPGPLVDDNREKEAVELVQNLTLKGESLFGINERLRKEGLANQLPQSDIERIYHQARTGRDIGARRPGTRLPRIIGIMSLVIGLFWLISTRVLSVYGVSAVLFGLILIFKPQNAGDPM